MKSKAINLAIIGFGPRGLSALENIFVELKNQNIKLNFKVTLFEVVDDLGAGEVWSIDQPDINWVNISQRALQGIEARPEVDLIDFVIPSFPTYADWLSDDADSNDVDPDDADPNNENIPDKFPPRNKVGAYLNQRATSIIKILEENNVVTMIKELITDVNYIDDEVVITDLSVNQYYFDEVLLTIGHQPTAPDEDIKEFVRESFNDSHLHFAETYPIQNIIDMDTHNGQSVVAIRGFGLAMIDAVRALSIGKNGHFEVTDTVTLESKFVSSKNVPKKIIPYSLNGLPVSPKPLNLKIDEQFAPTKKQLVHYESTIQNVVDKKQEVKDNSFLIELLADICIPIYKNLKDKDSTVNNYSDDELKNVLINWLPEQNYSHELIQTTNCNTEELIASFVAMACGKKPISLDYCVGQVARHCQRTLYKTFSHADLDEAIIASVIQFDEQMKRYSFGPPVESMQQILALHTAGIIDFSFVDDPEIEIDKEGWIFKKEQREIKVNSIINSVLCPPKLLEVSSLIVKNLLKNDLIEPIHTKLGIHTQQDGLIVSSNVNSKVHIAVLGRLAKGSVIGVDAILESFGYRINDWAKGFIQRIKEKSQYFQ